jgi:hypothetical protein
VDPIVTFVRQRNAADHGNSGEAQIDATAQVRTSKKMIKT